MEAAAGGAMKRKAEYWKALTEGRIQCRLCPQCCILRENDWGRCEARQNIDGTMTIPFYGHISALALDPIEKKPLRHFLPGTITFSVGFWHCTMACPFCQNWEIAHPSSDRNSTKRGSSLGGLVLEPEALIERAITSGCPSISVTYSEPCLHAEYLQDSMVLARKAGLKTILVTNGCILEEPARNILVLCDAVNVDLKTDSAEIYEKSLSGNIQVVQNFIRAAHEICHVEVTSLLVPGILDRSDQIEAIATYLASVSRAIPLHITSYHPAFHWCRPALSRQATEAIAKPAFGILDNVHLVLPYPY